MARETYLAAEDPAVDLAITAEMVNELEEYIIKEDLYRTLFVHTAHGDQSLQMTGGDLLTRLHRLQARHGELTATQQTQLDTLQANATAIIRSLRTRFHERLMREMKSRLDTLKWFLEESGDDRQRFRTNYPFEMRNRQRIDEIVKELGSDTPSDLSERLRNIDQRIRLLTMPSPFIWDEKLKHVYPQSPYWYLYLRP
jgi:hypothetical protein